MFKGKTVEPTGIDRIEDVIAQFEGVLTNLSLGVSEINGEVEDNTVMIRELTESNEALTATATRAIKISEKIASFLED